MNVNEYLALTDENSASFTAENPLDNLTDDGGFCGIFRTIGCIGDSLSSGEFESTNADGGKGYHDMFDYSWGQYLARLAGVKVYNFSRGGMTASEYWNGFAEQNGFWSADKLCQAYIIALGVNDILNCNQPLGGVSDIDTENYENNKPTFAGYYGKIIGRLKSMQPRARFFLMTMVHDDGGEERNALIDKHAALLRDIAGSIENAYVIDFARFGPVYDAAFNRRFFLGGHMNPAGYMLTAKLTASYIDYIIRHNMADFKQTGFIGTKLANSSAKV